MSKETPEYPPTMELYLRDNDGDLPYRLAVIRNRSEDTYEGTNTGIRQQKAKAVAADNSLVSETGTWETGTWETVNTGEVLKLDADNILYRLACECENLFDQLQEAFLKAKPKASDIEQCTEFQQRFSIWAAYLGVFAEKSQCLDTRLQKFPDLQDLATRLLDILRCSLHQYKDKLNDQEREQCSSSSDQVEASSSLSASLAAINNTLAQLNRLGVTIRQSSQDKIHIRAEKSTAHLDLTSFTYFCANVVQTLYPNAHQHLKNYLKDSMMNRYKKLIHQNPRYIKRTAHREPHGGLSSIPEVSTNKPQPNIPVIQQADIVTASVYRSGAHVITAPSQPDLSNVDIQRIRDRPRPPDEASTKFHRTSSVQVSQGNFPRPLAKNKNEDILACEWCTEPLDKKTLSESEWCRHIDRDLKPYVCLSEECQEAHKVYSTFDEWYSHMNSHSRRWYQQIYLSPTWVCTICEFDPNDYSNPQALYSHLQESHHDKFTNEQLHVISRQSKIKQSRAWDHCLLCEFTVEEEDTKGTTGFLKRTNGILKHEAFKSARTTYSMMHPGHYSSDDSDFSDASSDLDINTLQKRPQKTENRQKAIARHIAIHLQVLMLLTLRFAALQHDDKDLVDEDLKSDCVDIGDEESFPKGNDPENLLDIGSQSDVAWEDMDDEDESGVARGLKKGLMEDDVLVPDTDLDLDDIPRKYDGLVAENDAFLKEIIESGAWQSWQDESKELIRHDPDDYTIVWICATRTEYTAARAFLDGFHEKPIQIYTNVNYAYMYTLGQIEQHNIIIATSPNGGCGLSPVARIAREILHRFHNIKLSLLVGIGGGAPSAKHDIRLGDVAVGCSSLSAKEGGVLQHDFRRTRKNQQYVQMGNLNQPPACAQAAVHSLMSQYLLDGHKLKEAIDTAFDKNQRLRQRYQRPAATTDRLYQSQIVHSSDHETSCSEVCGDDPSSFIQRSERDEADLTIHHGLIASTNIHMKDALVRDELVAKGDIVCFETEAVGLMDYFPCVVIRGICDYSDSHYNKSWQGYASMTAAAYAKQLVCQISPRDVEAEKRILDIIS